ncbi:hypothetical protein EVAR_18094_1 [Eumeta japonica]|uniref:Uncharacterized protein n=1 Tax=Eumeta variegata TaxID=151549 RepID=A0A4C1VKG3_EUMVA|nr:hypothetical protein EVAR_18094_1 [Eumeta japonica]
MSFIFDFDLSGGPLNPRGPGLKPKKPYGRSGPVVVRECWSERASGSALVWRAGRQDLLNDIYSGCRRRALRGAADKFAA